MKKVRNILLIVSPCLIILGLLICVIGVQAGGSTHFGFSIQKGFVDYSKEGNPEIQEKQETVASFDTIRVDADSVALEIAEGDQFAVEYRVYGLEKWNTVSYRSENGVLQLSQGGDISFGTYEVNLEFLDWFINNNWEEESSYVRICVPRGHTLKEVTVDSDLGEITIQDLTVDGTMELEAGCGAVYLSNTKVAGKCLVDSELGEVSITACTLTDAEVDLECGSFAGDDITVERKCKVNCELGSIVFSTAEGISSGAYSYDCETELGSVVVAGKDCGTKAGGGSGSAQLLLWDDCGSITLD